MSDAWPETTPTPANWRHGLGLRVRMLVPVSATLSLLGLLGNYHLALEIFSHFIAWFALGTTLLALVLLALGSWRWAAVALVIALLQATQPLSWYLGDGGHVESGVPCRVLMANVLSSNTNHAALLALVKETNPDVVCVQEVGQDWADALQALHEDYPIHRVVARGDNFGMAVYSRVSPDVPDEVFRDELGIPAMTLPIEIDGVRFNLLSLHTVPPINGPMATLRNTQLDGARKWFEDQEGRAVIIGDLNTTMFSAAYRRWIRGLDIKNARAGHGPLGSWPTFVPFLRLPLDQCLVSSTIEVVDCRLGPDIDSDHRPLLVDLRIPR